MDLSFSLSSLLLCHRFNSLSQRFYCELSEKGHEVSVELDVHPELTIEAVNLYKPDLIIAPFFKEEDTKRGLGEALDPCCASRATGGQRAKRLRLGHTQR